MIKVTKDTKVNGPRKKEILLVLSQGSDKIY